MKPYKLFFIFCSVCLLAFLCVSCRTHGLFSDDFQAGETVTPEELLEISREIFTAADDPSVATNGCEVETLAPDDIVYWLDGGSVYHADKECYHLARKDIKKIREGKVSEAVSNGKERLCASCAPRKVDP